MRSVIATRRARQLGWRYLGQALLLAGRAPRRLTWRQVVNRPLAWYRSVGRSDARTDRVPWITYGALDFIDSRLRPGMRVLEFGAGGSTLFFADRRADLVTIEHAPEWAEEVSEAVGERADFVWELHLVEPVASEANGALNTTDPDSFASTHRGDEGKSFEDYVRTIDRYPDAEFDLVLVDGRARASCFKRALPKVRRGGFVVLDDSERPQYRDTMALPAEDEWRRRDFYGPGPYHEWFWQTSVWERRKA
jgi:predicted O-methyltransferase YrrM